MNKKVFISGVSGQDGSLMVEYLLNNTDVEIIGGIRRTSQIIDQNIKEFLKNDRFSIIHFDLNDVHSITSTIKNQRPDYFINFGAQTFVADSWESPVNHIMTNTLGVLHILEAIKNYNPECRFYSSGSSEQFGDVEYSPQDEKHPHKARSPYGVSKIASGQLVKVYRESYNLYAVHGVLFNHESRLRPDYFVTQKIAKGVARIKKAIDAGEHFEPIELGNLDAKRDWSHAKDFVRAIWAMLNQDKPKEYVLSSNETHSISEFIEIAFHRAGVKADKVNWLGNNTKYVTFEHGQTTRDSKPLVVVNPKFFRPAEVDLLWGNSDKARKELNWTPEYDFESLVNEMVDSAIYGRE